MALDIVTDSLGKNTELESLENMAGSTDCALVKTGETFSAGNITSIVINEDAVLSSLKSPNETELLTGVSQGLKNFNGATLKSGLFISAGKYNKGRYYSSVTVTSGSIMVYYNYKKTF